jgi:ABC-2 type transport system ATP-binding protein
MYYTGPKKIINQRINEMLELVGLENKADRPVSGFSGGERQRLGIAQAEIHNPSLLILDEPAAALDPIGRRDMLEIMKILKETTHTTIFYSTHILDDVQKVSDSVAIIDNGKLVTQGSIEQILNGGSDIVYCVKIKGGKNQDIVDRLANESWISGLSFDDSTNITNWEIRVSDQEKAEENLLSLMSDKGIKIIDYGQKKVELEDIFMNLVEVGA